MTPSPLSPERDDLSRTPARGYGRPLLAGVAAAVVAAAIIGGVIVVAGGSSSESTADAPASERPVTPTMSAPMTTSTPEIRTETRTETQTATVAPPAVETESAATDAPANTSSDTQVYAYPGPGTALMVDAPAGLYVEARNTPQTKGDTWYDFVYGNTTHDSTYTRYRQPYVRLGVTDFDSSPDIASVARDSVKAIEKNKNFTNIVVADPSYVDYCGTTAVDIEFTETNKYGFDRHGIERLWISGDQTLIVELDTPADSWDAWSGSFESMVSTCAEQ